MRYRRYTRGFEFLLVAAVGLFLSQQALALPSWGKFVQWTANDVAEGDISSALHYVVAKTGFPLTFGHFKLTEDRQLATSRFRMWSQQAGDLPVRSASIRIWADKTTGKTIRGEAFVGAPPANRALLPRVVLTATDTMKAVDKHLGKGGYGDRAHRNVTWRDYYEDGHVVRVVRVLGGHGRYVLELEGDEGVVRKSRFEEFPKADAVSSVPAKLYPVYEEVEGTTQQLDRVETSLQNLLSEVSAPDEDPFTKLRTRKWTSDKYDPLVGATADGQALGFWAMSYVRSLAAGLVAQIPKRANSYADGVVLEGKYVTVSLHPLAREAFPNLSFQPGYSTILKPNWVESTGNGDSYEMQPQTALRGKLVASAEDALGRPARRLADHDPKSYIEDGFDELQVYWSVDRFMTLLQKMGFADPELSVRPFNAILFDPDVTYRDNAFYTDDTINFTTYSGNHPNFARDNTTIWHELGHGVMDRVMGDFLTLDDTGGLSEGMADFLALLVIEKSTGGKAFAGKDGLRIFNGTGFFLTNEVHDDGEAYGGSLADFLKLAINHYGPRGVDMVTDLTLEAMRFARNHPGLTAEDWFGRLFFADTRGNALRQAGALAPLLRQALADRNFSLEGKAPAKFDLKNGATLVTATGAGSRGRPIPVSLKPDQTSRAKLSVSLTSGVHEFVYPVRVEIGLRGGPLQGGIRWENEGKEPFTAELTKDGDVATFDVGVTGVCDTVNRPDGTCVDFAYVKVFEPGKDEPVAKKRFYYQVKPLAAQ